jgi:hypothetical protein
VAQLREPLNAHLSWLGCSKAADQGDQSVPAISTFRLYDTALSPSCVAALLDKLPRPPPLPETPENGRELWALNREAVKAIQEPTAVLPSASAEAVTKSEPLPPQQHLIKGASLRPPNPQSSAYFGVRLPSTPQPGGRLPCRVGAHSASSAATHTLADTAPHVPSPPTDDTHATAHPLMTPTPRPHPLMTPTPRPNRSVP